MYRRCQCINCENQISPGRESDDLTIIALEKGVQSSQYTDLEDEEFAEFVFAATFDSDRDSEDHH